ncbi:MAG TPA: plastocyanin/azurin family copper-binding protein [Chitinophagaceae bacterium]|jgi:plastocyanin|nr:plastocyanin/azurin family copper-binding protein [Chitinophagaceae bacterium]
MKQWIGIACLLVAGSFAACEKESSFENELTASASSARETATSYEYTVEITSNGFNPIELNVPSGAPVMWVNTDDRVHDVISSTGKVNSGDMNPGDTYSFTFQGIEDHSYYCSKHSGETGTIHVKGVR